MTETARTYTFTFDPDPEGGFVVTCPALPGLVTHGADLDEARDMARDAMEGYIDTLLEDGELVPESDQPHAGMRFGQLAHVLRNGIDKPAPLFEQLTTNITEAA